MTTDVITLHPNDNLLKVEEIFTNNDFHHIPIVDEKGCVLGIISKNDFHKMQHSFTIFETKASKKANYAIFQATLVGEIMEKKVAQLNPNDSALVAIGIFRENLFHALPIVNESNVLVGILTTYDLLTYAYNEPVYMN
jgi:CBS-domain-containing membrane protein